MHGRKQARMPSEPSEIMYGSLILSSLHCRSTCQHLLKFGGHLNLCTGQDGTLARTPEGTMWSEVPCKLVWFSLETPQTQCWAVLVVTKLSGTTYWIQNTKTRQHCLAVHFDRLKLCPPSVQYTWAKKFWSLPKTSQVTVIMNFMELVLNYWITLRMHAPDLLPSPSHQKPIVRPHWVDQWKKNAINLAVLHATVTGPALINCA